MCGTPLVVQPMRGYHLHSTNYSQTETQPRPGSSGSRGGALDLGVIIFGPASFHLWGSPLSQLFTCWWTGLFICREVRRGRSPYTSGAHSVQKSLKKNCVGKHKTQTASHVWKLCSTVVKKCVSWSNTSVMKCIRGHFLYSEWVPCDTCC